MIKPIHPRTATVLRLNLFANLKTFSELENRLSSLHGNQTRGEAFEVFAEAYLATQRKHDVAQVWPLATLPRSLSERFGLPLKDNGIDGIYEALPSGYCAYQVKFRSGRAPLTWEELSTFIGLTDSPEIRSKVLFTNCDRVAAVATGRRSFFCIRGADLDRLKELDFQIIEAWLSEKVVPSPKSPPQPHQRAAMEALLPALEQHARVSAIMACGTGKTRLALWLAEERGAGLILVLLPSLALLRQTLHEWLRETKIIQLAYLCVCSDQSVDRDADEMCASQSDLDFEVSTSSDNVRRFLDTPYLGTKVVFSTYQSAKVVGAALKPEERFDFAVFDEAHKTAGRGGRNFSFALEDRNLPIAKRLFLTATPRHYNPHKKDAKGESAEVFSMDATEVYGPQAYRLTFAQAVREKIICGYKILVSVITNETLSNEVLGGDAVVNGDFVRARQVAHQIALRDAIQKHGVRKIFTFHKTVRSAASFVALGNEGVLAHLEGFSAMHVNGSMSVAEREKLMREFREADRAVMSNARCLTEGVDIPAVDLVAFLTPKKSRVDIVQAIGRAMRKAPGKAVGYVLVPLYIEVAKGESLDAAFARADFDHVAEVLQSLQEHDEVLAEMIRTAGTQMGRKLGFDDGLFSERIEFAGTCVGADAIRQAVATRCVDQLTSTWDVTFGKLQAFKQRFTHCNVETGWEEDPALASWVANQRTTKNGGALRPDRQKRLDDLGFTWNYQEQKAEETWMHHYEMLVGYVKKNGNPHVPHRCCGFETLANWVWTQRGRKKNGQLSPDQIQFLEKLGFRWNNSAKFEEKLAQIQEFVDRERHCDIRIDHPELGQTVNVLRTYKRQGKLLPDQIKCLEDLGFSWKARRKAERGSARRPGR